MSVHSHLLLLQKTDLLHIPHLLSFSGVSLRIEAEALCSHSQQITEEA